MMGRKSRMQGKESSEQKTKVKSSAGIDVCKSWLDAHVLPEGRSLRVANDARGHRQLKKWLTEHDVSLVAIEALQELIAGRSGAVAEQTALENQLAAANTTFLRRQLKGRIDRIAKDVASLQTEIERRIGCDQALARRYAILLSIPGVGPVTAATLIAGMTELGTCSAKQIAMLSGLAPVADQSGARDGQRAIRGGRAAVRRVLYLCALSAKRCNPAMSALYNRLTAAGRPHKVALIAVARKLIVLANTLIAQNRSWQSQPPIHA